MSLLDKDLEQLQVASGYKFSATKIEKLGAAEYTLATIVMDVSSSVIDFANQLETALKTIFQACQKSPRKDNLMLRVTAFNHDLHELHGFKLLGTIQASDYTNILRVQGNTALFDAADEAIQATSTYGKQLTDQDFLVNAIVVIVSDGEDNSSHIDAANVKKSVMKARKSENLESITLILVGVTNDNDNLNTYLQDFKDEAGIDQYVSIGKATAGKIAKLADFVSQSISSTSSALGTGAPSQPLNPASFKF